MPFGRSQTSRIAAPRRDQQADGAARDREHGALGEQLPNEAAAAGAERGTDRDLGLSRRRAGEHQVRHVGAGNQQHQADGAEQHEQRRAGVADDVLAERRDREADVGIALGELRLQPSRDGRDVGRRAIRRYARLQPPDDLDVPGTAVRHAEHLVVLDRRPQLHARRVREAGGQNADDHVRLAVEREHAPDRRGAGAEPLLPELMTEQHDAGAARFVLLWAKRAPEDWLHAQHAEQARAHLSAVQPHRFTDARQRHPERVARGNIGQRVVLRADVEEVRRGHHGLVTVPRQMEYADELGRPVIRQRFEQDAVHDREDGAVGPDAERQRDERHDREGRRLPEATERVHNVLAHGVHDVPAAAARSVPAPLRDGWRGVPVFGPGWQEVAGAGRARSTRLFAAGTVQSRNRTRGVTWEEAGEQSAGRA